MKFNADSRLGNSSVWVSFLARNFLDGVWNRNCWNLMAKEQRVFWALPPKVHKGGPCLMIIISSSFSFSAILFLPADNIEWGGPKRDGDAEVLGLRGRHYIFIVGQPSAKALTLGRVAVAGGTFLFSIPLPLFSGLCFQRILAWLPHKMKQNVVRVSFGFRRAEKIGIAALVLGWQDGRMAGRKDGRTAGISTGVEAPNVLQATKDSAAELMKPIN